MVGLPVEVINTDWSGIVASGVIAGAVSAGTVLGTWKLTQKSQRATRDAADLQVWREYLAGAEKIFMEDASRRFAEERVAAKSGYFPESVWDSAAFDSVESEFWKTLNSTPPRARTSGDVIRVCLEYEFDYLGNRYGPRVAEIEAHDWEVKKGSEYREACRRLAAYSGGDTKEECRLKKLMDEAYGDWGMARLDDESAYRWSAESRSTQLLQTVRSLKGESFKWASAGGGWKSRADVSRSHERLRYKANMLGRLESDRVGAYWG